MKTTPKPKVFISYTWKTPGNKERVRELAERLRSERIDCRIDQFFQENLYGFRPPNDWKPWAEDQIREADTVLLVYSPGYAFPGSASEWDVKCMEKDFTSGHSEQSKFIPIGFGPYSLNNQYAPDSYFGELTRKSTYYDVTADNEITSLLKRIRSDFRIRHPRSGAFISYSHADKRWFELLLKQLALLKQLGADIWTDQDIKPGAKWHEDIQDALDNARVAILLVTPAFFQSSYIASDELPKMLEAANSEGLVIFWIPIEHSNYRFSRIAKFQAAHPPSEPLQALSQSKRNEAFVNITSKLAEELGISPP